MTKPNKDLKPNLHDTMDAQVWAKEFIRIKNEVNFEIDEGLMIGWFANAIMAGHDAATRSS